MILTVPEEGAIAASGASVAIKSENVLEVEAAIAVESEEMGLGWRCN